LGIVTEIKLLQPEKADAPMDVTLLGIVTEVRALQQSKANFPILVTPDSILIVLMELK
jgi:hypothetical protein